ncbi:MAG: hypothetical protein Q7U41_02980 [Microbacterium sp.]|nr:hypothetical protein [Microbacterium sp.]
MSLASMLDGDDAPRCSAAGCGAAANWSLHWRNPRIHAGDRRKTWLACDQHREHLLGFLHDRDFPVEIERFAQ